MTHRPGPKDDIALQLIELTADRVAPTVSEAQIMLAGLDAGEIAAWMLSPVAADFSLLDDTADLPPGSSLVLLVDSDIPKVH